jgi:ubiquinone/menaquinone biosynthesis C-methylase UbiE
MSSRKIWDFWAKRYESLWVQKYSLGPTRRAVARFIGQKLQKDREYKILDIGCGTGQLLRDIKCNFNDYNIKFYGIDYSGQMIEEAKVRDGSLFLSIMDIKDLDKIKDKFDFVTCTHSFPYYEDQKKAIQDMRKLLKENGYLLLAQASQNSFYDGIAMFFVKFTTGMARYPSVKKVYLMAEEFFCLEEIIRIREKFYMPSIYFFAMRGI